MKSVVRFYIATSIGETAQNMKSVVKFYIATSIGETAQNMKSVVKFCKLPQLEKLHKI